MLELARLCISVHPGPGVVVGLVVRPSGSVLRGWGPGWSRDAAPLTIHPRPAPSALGRRCRGGKGGVMSEFVAGVHAVIEVAGDVRVDITTRTRRRPGPRRRAGSWVSRVSVVTDRFAPSRSIICPNSSEIVGG